MEKYIEYTKAFANNSKVIDWLNSTGKNYLAKHTPTQDEVEHIIDYLISDDAPKNIAGMSYELALKGTEKWNKALIKKGEHIKETEKDTEVLLDFKDGFKIVKLVGKNAYEREGYLMRHCVASYYGKSTEIYSLRDKNNMPHCTMEKDNQIKGKGNGDIHPNYISYVIQFLEKIGMTVGDNEMKHLGYVNIEKLLPELSEDTHKLLYGGKYYPQNKGYENLKDKEGNQYLGMDILDYFPMFTEEIEETDTSFSMKLKLNFDMSLIAEYHKKTLNKLTSILGIKKKQKKSDSEFIYVKEDNAKVSAEDNAKVSAEDNAKVSAGNNAKVSAEDNATVSAGYNAKVSAGNYAKVSAGNYAKVSAGYNATVSAEDNATVSAGYNAKVSAEDNAKVSAGYNATVSAGNNAKVSAGNYAKVSAEDNATVSAGNNAKVSAEDNATVSAGNNAKVSAGSESKLSADKHSILVADHKGKAKGKIGTLIILTERENKNNEWVIIDYKAELVDGKKIKADTWYKLVDGKFVETDDSNE